MKTKPFDLEFSKTSLAAVTRDGKPVRLLVFDLKSEFPIGGAIDYGGKEGLQTWTLDGRVMLPSQNLPDVPSDMDLLTPVEDVVRFVNIFQTQDGQIEAGDTLHATEEAAAKEIPGSAETLIRTIPVSIEL